MIITISCTCLFYSDGKIEYVMQGAYGSTWDLGLRYTEYHIQCISYSKKNVSFNLWMSHQRARLELLATRAIDWKYELYTILYRLYTFTNSVFWRPKVLGIIAGAIGIVASKSPSLRELKCLWIAHITMVCRS